MDQKNLPLISIVIPTLNEETDIQSCIDSVLKTNYPQDKIEIIVADTGSTDQTINVAKKNNVQIIEIKEINPTAALGLNYGMKNASGEYIQYLAADSLLEKNWLLNALQEFDNQIEKKVKVGVVGGITKEFNPNSSMFSYLLSAGLSSSESISGNVIFNAGSGLILKNFILTNKIEFNPLLISEDEVDFGIKINEAGFTYRKIAQTMIYHKLGLKNNLSSFLKMIRRYWKQGIGLGQIRNLHSNSKYLREYIKSIRIYKLAAFFPMIAILTVVIFLTMPVIGILLVIAGLIIYIGIILLLSSKYKVRIKSAFILSFWYLMTAWVTISGYLYFNLVKPMKYNPHAT